MRGGAHPALLTRTSRRPKCSSVASTRLSGASSLARSTNTISDRSGGETGKRPRLGQLLGRACGETECEAGARQIEGDRASDSASGAGNERDFLIEGCHRVSAADLWKIRSWNEAIITCGGRLATTCSSNASENQG